MVDGAVVIETKIDDKKAQEKLTKLNQKIEKIKSNLAKSESAKSAIEEQLNNSKKAALQAEKEIEEYTKRLKETTDATGGNDPFSEKWRQRIEESKKHLAEQDQITQKLDAKYASITDKVLEQKEALKAAEEAAGEQQTKLAGAKKAADELAESTKKISPAAEEATKRFEKLAKRIKGLAKRVFIFSMITAALRKIKAYMWEAVQTNQDAMESVARLKAALRTLAQPLVHIVIPAFTTLANILTYLVNGAARLLSALFGSTYEASKKAAKSMYDQQNAIEGIGTAAKKANKYLAPFDELNTISGGDESGGTSGGRAPDFDGNIDNGIQAVIAIMTGVALLALGAILTFSGHVGVGIALMVAGALTIYGAFASDGGEAAKALVETGLANILIAIGPMIAMLGVVLLMTGNIPFGLGLLIAGIAMFGVGEAAANWELLSTNLVGALANMLIDIAPYIALFGAVLLFVPGQQALGIGLILAGIALFAVGEVAANWGLISQDLTSALVKIFSDIAPYIAVIGLLLAFVPGMQAIGIGMIIAGLGMFAFSAIAPNWNFLADKVKEIWQSIKNFWNANIAPVFTAEWWKKLGKNIMNGLISAVESGINWVLGGVRNLVNRVAGVLNKIPGVNISGVNWSDVHIPRLAQGAVIPANREFLAVLGDQKHGTNIEAPADLIRQIVRDEIGNAAGGTHVTIVLDSVDGKKLFDAFVRENNAVVRATGASPLKV